MKPHPQKTALPARQPQLQTLFQLIDDPDELIFASIAARILEHGDHALPCIRDARERFANDSLVVQRCDELEAAIDLSQPELSANAKRHSADAMRELIRSFGGSHVCLKILAESGYDFRPKQTGGSWTECHSLITRRVILSDCWSIIYDLEKNEEPCDLYTKGFIEDRQQYTIHDKDAEKLVDAVCAYLREVKR